MSALTDALTEAGLQGAPGGPQTPAEPEGADPTWVLVCDDELVALAQSAAGQWRRPLETVDVTSVSSLAAAVARGYRSLLLRGLLHEDNPDGAALLLPLSLVGHLPGIMATSVTADFTQVSGAERFELFADDAGRFVAVTTRPGGLHTLAYVDGHVGLSFFAELAVVHQAAADPSLDSFAILVRGRDEELAGGFVVGETVTRLGRTASGFGPVDGPDVPGTVDAWRAEITRLLRVT